MRFSQERAAHCGDHSSRPCLAAWLQQPTRGLLVALACAFATEANSLSRAHSVSRAGSPLLFGLAPRGVFRAPDVAIGAVGSYPTFSPLPAELALEDVSQVSLFDVTELPSAGGLFSVALSVTSLHRIPTESERCTPSVQLCRM